MNSGIDWDNQFKVRPRLNASKKHEHIKLEIVLCLLEKYNKNKNWIRIYTEQPIGEGKIPDVYFENIAKKEIICYEIQKSISEKWKKETAEIYETINESKFPFMKVDWVLIEENKLSDDLETLSKEVKRLIV